MIKKYLFSFFLAAPALAESYAMRAHVLRLKPGQDVYKKIAA